MPCILGDDQAEVQFMSNMDADTKFLVPYGEALQVWLGHFVEDVMDQQVVKTDMKLRHIFNKAVEVKYVMCKNIIIGTIEENLIFRSFSLKHDKYVEDFYLLGQQYLDGQDHK